MHETDVFQRDCLPRCATEGSMDRDEENRVENDVTIRDTTLTNRTC